MQSVFMLIKTEVTVRMKRKSKCRLSHQFSDFEVCKDKICKEHDVKMLQKNNVQ